MSRLCWSQNVSSNQCHPNDEIVIFRNSSTNSQIFSLSKSFTSQNDNSTVVACDIDNSLFSEAFHINKSWRVDKVRLFITLGLKCIIWVSPCINFAFICTTQFICILLRKWEQIKCEGLILKTCQCDRKFWRCTNCNKFDVVISWNHSWCLLFKDIFFSETQHIFNEKIFTENTIQNYHQQFEGSLMLCWFIFEWRIVIQEPTSFGLQNILEPQTYRRPSAWN